MSCVPPKALEFLARQQDADTRFEGLDCVSKRTQMKKTINTPGNLSLTKLPLVSQRHCSDFGWPVRAASVIGLPSINSLNRKLNISSKDCQF